MSPCRQGLAAGGLPQQSPEPAHHRGHQQSGRQAPGSTEAHHIPLALGVGSQAPIRLFLKSRYEHWGLLTTTFPHGLCTGVSRNLLL